MTPKKELKLAYAIAGILLFVGAISYAAFPKKAPEQPVRLMFHAVSGKVLFSHKDHASEAEYGIACIECHHHPDDENDIDYSPCGDCHHVPEGDQKVPEACLDCHEVDEIEDSEIIKSGDAFHDQCIGCHQEYGAGPVECSSCHVL